SGRYEEAAEAFGKAASILASLGMVDDYRMAALYNNMSWVAGIQRFSLSVYTDSYGAQLSGKSCAVYQGMEDTWAAGKTDTIKCNFAEPYTFTADGSIEYDENKQVYVAVWDKSTCEEYQDILMELRYEVQSAFDAFAYDYPEVFWLGKVTYFYGISFNRADDSSSQIKGTISGISICGVGEVTNSDGSTCLREKYAGAAEEISAFQYAVDEAAAQISRMLPEDADQWDQVKAIHDYICNTVSYGENEYAHTAAGVFHKEDKTVVCEGYAKAMKILCRRFGITSALIVGDALKSSGSREAHMWNYVKMDDGCWYLLDPTWDDQAGSIRYVYFLVGSNNQGFNAVISTERQNYTKFSQASYTASFTLPVLSENHYCLWKVEEEVPPSCLAAGQTYYTCERDGCSEVKTVTYEPLGHEFSEEWTIDQEPTCTNQGEKSHHCTRCTERSDIMVISANGHTWQPGKVTKKATCTEAGSQIYFCTDCGTTKTEEMPTLGGHDYNSDWTVDRASTCSTAGEKSHHCTRCGAREDVTKLSLAAHSWDTGTVIKASTCTASGVRSYTCTACNKATKTENLSALGHAYSSTWTVDRASTCSTAGEKSRHCTRCGAREDVTKLSLAAHSWNKGAVTKASTCTASGVRTYTCTACKATKTKSISAPGHKYGAWTVKKEATVLKAGTSIRTCIRCGKAETRTISRLKRTIQLNLTSLPLRTGQSTSAVKVTKMTKGDYIKSWKSSNTKIVSVSKKGVITGKKAGKATVTVVLASGAKASVKVTVQKNPVETTALAVQGKSTAIKNKLLTLKKGKKETLIVSLTPVTSSDKVTYAVSDKKIATVSTKGVVTARKSGTAAITVRAGKKKVILKVIVR
ncbi:MAG: Ig-like domain-containing protein, partial [Lachnospiraceae bacterium]|nr:Ig-like domain-containing protein [Lachnospiraceae bacterium]